MSGMFLWRHNYVTPWLIVLILVCMNKEDPYLPIDTKINFIGGSVRKTWRGLQQPPLIRRVTKNSLLNEGLPKNKTKQNKTKQNKNGNTNGKYHTRMILYCYAAL